MGAEGAEEQRGRIMHSAHFSLARLLLEDPWLTKSSQSDQNSGGDQTSVNVHLESLLELAPSYGE